MDWTNKLSDHTEGRVVAIDGKTVRGSNDKGNSPIHLVSAWVDENDMILGQVKTDYVLALKGNQGLFHKEVEEYMEDAIKNNFKDMKCSKKVTKEKAHGRIEKREYFQTNDIAWFSEKSLWKGLKSIGMVRRTVIKDDKRTVEKCYYISSLEAPTDGECELFAKAIRKHWGIESCHWLLDVIFKEDKSLVRKNNGAENLSMLRKIAMNILKKDIPAEKKMSKNMKRFRAAMD